MLATIYVIVLMLVILSSSLLTQSVSTLHTAELRVSQMKAFQLAEAGIDEALGEWKQQSFSAATCDTLAQTLHPTGDPVAVGSGSYAVTASLVDGACRIRALGATGPQQCIEVRVAPAALHFPGQLVGVKSIVVGYGATVEGTLAIGSEEQVRGDPFRTFEGAYFRMRSELQAPPEPAGRLVIPETANPYQLIGVRGLTLQGRNLGNASKQARWREKMGQTLGVPAAQVFDRIGTVSGDRFQEFFDQANQLAVVPEGLDCSQTLVVEPHATAELSGATQCFSSVTVKAYGTLVVPAKSKIFVTSADTGRYSVSIGAHADLYARNTRGEAMPGGFELRVADGRPILLRAGSDFSGTLVAPHATVTVGYDSDTFADEGIVGDADGSESPGEDDGGSSDPPLDDSTISRVVGNRIVVNAKAQLHLGAAEESSEDLDAGVIKMWQQPVVSSCSGS
ncbi:MAG: hypothetical protein HY352_03940 [Candidatus Omnitrophica bacterium]|nr:hypothetical protein [Candidatus Omnitrophota bacterium]